MAALDLKPKSKKRKEVSQDAEPTEATAFRAPVETLEMLSDDEGPDDAASDDGQVDDFP